MQINVLVFICGIPFGGRFTVPRINSKFHAKCKFNLNINIILIILIINNLISNSPSSNCIKVLNKKLKDVLILVIFDFYQK